MVWGGRVIPVPLVDNAVRFSEPPLETRWPLAANGLHEGPGTGLAHHEDAFAAEALSFLDPAIIICLA